MNPFDDPFSPGGGSFSDLFARPKVTLKNPKWEVEEVGFNEETDISIEADIPEAHAHKTKVAFELFAKTPEGSESISKAEGQAKQGRDLTKIPVYMPSYKDEEGNLLGKVEYYFTAKHSESDLFGQGCVRYLLHRLRLHLCLSVKTPSRAVLHPGTRRGEISRFRK